MSDLIADGIHKKFNCWECGIDMIIISESEELIKYCPYCEAELQDNYDISEDDITTEETGYEDLPNDWRL
tara:strand:- start:823 stop:1032 length:210 start_codon:yes stop_codon:yes gene_type:complete